MWCDVMHYALLQVKCKSIYRPECECVAETMCGIADSMSRWKYILFTISSDQQYSKLATSCHENGCQCEWGFSVSGFNIFSYFVWATFWEVFRKRKAFEIMFSIYLEIDPCHPCLYIWIEYLSHAFSRMNVSVYWGWCQLDLSAIISNAY